MSRSKKGRVPMLAVVAFLLGSVSLVGCQPAQPVATPKAAEKGAVATPTKAAEKAAAAPAKAVEKPVRGGTLRIVTTRTIDTLDPQSGVETASVQLVYEPYIHTDGDWNITKDGLFKDWSISPDGKAITFKLREGVKFHDGTDFDAAAAKFNMERVKDPATKSPQRNYFDFVASVEVVDNLTVRFNLSRPDSMLLASLGSRGGMVPSPAAVKKYGQDFARNPVGTGPFQFVEWAPGDHISLKRFEGYWGKDKDGNQLPYLDGVVFKLMSGAQEAATATLRTGDGDFLGGIPVEQWSLVKSDAKLITTGWQSLTIQLVMFNTKRSPFNNKALREAVALAADREGIAAVMGGGATSHASLMTPVYPWAYDPKLGVFPARDLAKAKAKMAEAGYPAGGLKVKWPSQTSSEQLKTNQILKANLAEIGIEVEIETMANAEFLTRILSQEGESKYQILYYMTPTGLPEVGHAFNNFFHSKGSRNNLGPYSNPQVDDLIEKARNTYDQKERAALYQKAATMIREDMPVVPLKINNSLDAVSVKVRNYVPIHSSSGLENRVFALTWLAQ